MPPKVDDCCAVAAPNIGCVVVAPKGFAAAVAPKGLALGVLLNPKVPAVVVVDPKPVVGLPNKLWETVGCAVIPKPVPALPKLVWPKPGLVSACPNMEDAPVGAPPNGVVPKPVCC